MVGELFVGILTAVFLFAVWLIALAAPMFGGAILFEYLRDERRFGRSRVGQYSWLITLVYWIAIVLYYALYIALFLALFVIPPAMP